MATVESRKDEEATTIKVASSKATRNIAKLKRQPTKPSKPGNWKDATTSLDNEEKKRAKEAGNAAPPSPIINQLDPPAQVTFDTGRPLDDVPDLIYCKLCKKGVIRTSGKEHIDECLRIKREKAQRKKEAREARERAKEAAREEEARKNDPDGGAGRDDDDSDADEPTERKGNSGKTTKKATGKKPDVGGKKRKAEGDLEKGKAKKKKDEPKPKTAKPKGPVDVERQCGVILPNGQPCARSLTCKSHSMSAKRSVPGRSLPYDMLLVAYQKKNQAKQQRAAIDANAPLEDDDDPNAGAVDSDEETAAVMNALANWRPQPVIPQPIIAPIKRQYQLARLHEQLQTVTNGGRLNIFKVVGFGAQKLPEGHPGLYQQEEEHAGDPDVSMQDAFSRRSSTFSLAGPPQRRPSVTSRA
ncbi:SAGA complex subunit Sgf73 [Neurospora sp. IMI 360204]|nr:SAGA complex subunit Sgf73 [Neurospora sp. IMI 360204]